MNILIQPNIQGNTRRKQFKCLNVGDVFTTVNPFSESFKPLTSNNELKLVIYIKVGVCHSINLCNGLEWAFKLEDLVYDVTDICNVVLTM